MVKSMIGLGMAIGGHLSNKSARELGLVFSRGGKKLSEIFTVW